MSDREEATLILVRHGESVFNAADRFTGLVDAALSDRGRREAAAAAWMMARAELEPDLVYTSMLSRSLDTARIMLAVLGGDQVELRPRWDLCERNYGDLTGRTRSEIRRQVGEECFHRWRRTVDGRPPALEPTDARHPRQLFPAAGVPAALLVGTESLREVIARVAAFVETALRPALRTHRCVMVVGHGNSLRALAAVLDELSDQEIERLNLPTGQPLRYGWDRGGDHPTVRGGRYLDPSTARWAAAALDAAGGT